MNPHNFSQVIFDKSTKNIYGERTASLTNVVGKSGYLSAKN
jgi:hypothetical protein